MSNQPMIRILDTDRFRSALIATIAGGALCVLTSSLVCSPAAAQAQPSYSAQSVLDFFLAPRPGGTRAVCVGGCAKQADPVRNTFDLEVTFDLNSDALTEPARRNLSEFAKALNDPRLETLRFAIDGHTDARGPETYNLTLSERRAQSVVSFLAQQGINRERLAPKGYGKTQPKTDDPFDGANRRVETRLLQ
ncbi:OmpA family protein [uncultured Alsobacter sp.]|uniref:OmpA family protein n=1 Tax=uncultured Alsobacter sp. TaxID=1748258 RepID=UPI0025E3FB9B|nr:OmpA family protein [uncultured Alsobacter sp.]